MLSSVLFSRGYDEYEPFNCNDGGKHMEGINSQTALWIAGMICFMIIANRVRQMLRPLDSFTKYCLLGVIVAIILIFVFFFF
uniref:Uncharacterized protein n=1 Tax=Cyphia glandulifera TaxID=2041119 RepID=A0A291F4F1_9ASTR|nr:hypothetical protein Cyp_gla1Pt0072 [Cyphia glandulifera]ATG26981.1 hypothetical protein Cyp_gla1Pt0072 [Cyphia glandulifera]